MTDPQHKPAPGRAVLPDELATRRVRALDFRRPTRFSRDQMRRLEQAHDGFCRAASTRLSAELRTGFEFEIVGSDQLSFGSVFNEVPDDALIVAIDVRPIGTQVGLVFELPLCVNLVDRLLGSGHRPRTELPEKLTDLETVVLQRVVRSIVQPLSATWFDLAGVEFHIRSVSASPSNAQFAAPSEPTLLLSCQARMDTLVSPVKFCLPHAAVEPLIEHLETSHGRRPAIDPRTSALVRQAVSAVDVELRAEVGAVDLTIDEVLALRPGDVVDLRRAVASGVTVYAGDVPAYIATPGRNNALRAVQLTAPWQEPA